MQEFKKNVTRKAGFCLIKFMMQDLLNIWGVIKETTGSQRFGGVQGLRFK